VPTTRTHPSGGFSQDVDSTARRPPDHVEIADEPLEPTLEEGISSYWPRKILKILQGAVLMGKKL
jgi:hypothetical protein